jgi:hypothetical protein
MDIEEPRTAIRATTAQVGLVPDQLDGVLEIRMQRMVEVQFRLHSAVGVKLKLISFILPSLILCKPLFFSRLFSSYTLNPNVGFFLPFRLSDSFLDSNCDRCANLCHA